MPSPSILIRCLLLMAAGALVLHFTSRWSKERPPVGYRIVPLMQGAKAVGLPLAGVAVDPNRKDVYAVVGGKNAHLPADFFVLWKRRDGEHYGLTLFQQNQGARAFCQIDRNGRLEKLDNFWSAASSTPLEVNHSVEEEAALRSIVQALPPSFALAGKP